MRLKKISMRLKSKNIHQKMTKPKPTSSPFSEKTMIEMLMQRQYEQENDVSVLLERYKELLRTVSRMEREIDDETL